MDPILVIKLEKTMPGPGHPQAMKTCEQHLGVPGAQLFLPFIAFSGMPTARLFVWAEVVKATLNPAGKGICGGKLIPADISKWKPLAQLGGVTERVTENADLEFTVSHLTLKASRQQVHALLAFERKSETLLIYTSRQAIKAQAVVAMLVELERAAAEKLGLRLGHPRQNVLWMPKEPIYLEARDQLCQPARASVEADATQPKEADSRRLIALDWGRQVIRFYREDWAGQWLPAPVLPPTWVLPEQLSLREVQDNFRNVARKFNAQATANLSGIRPSILPITRGRHVDERLSV